VVGAGYIGLELGIAMAKLGVQVSVLETGSQILPQYDADLVRPVAKRMRALGVRLHLDALASEFVDGKVRFSAGKDGSPQEIAAEKVLVAVGRRPVVDGFGLEALGLDREGPFLRIDDRCRTSMRDVFAIGDVSGNPMLAHRAMAQGKIVAEIVSGRPARWDKSVVPEVCFTDPEIVCVGELPRKGGDLRSVEFGFQANGRALTLNRTDGFVRVTWEPGRDLIRGLQAVGPHVSGMAAGFATAIEMGATLRDVADTIHAHPTLEEAIQEAAMGALQEALHA
jgi:dihydrolipoamide dehydrogenase